MPDLLITRALPNPEGKDRTPANQVTNDQLNAEWVEFRNDSGRDLRVEGVTLHHYTFNDRCAKTGEGRLYGFGNGLAANHAIRVHSGAGITWLEVLTWHVYLDHGNYVWNNRCGDTCVLRGADGTLIDWASYEPNPPEGVELERTRGTNRLAAAVYAARR